MARSHPDPTRPGPNRLDFALPALAVALALALRLVLMSASSGLTMDSPLYVRMSEWLASGRLEASPAHHGYPMLMAVAVRVLPGRELPGRMVSLLASLVLVTSVWTVARRRSSPWRAFVPALLVALHPLLASYGVAVMTESAFMALAFGAVALLDSGRTRAGGALLGAAWWVRPEAAVIAPFAILLTPVRWRTRLTALALAACVALPYTVVLRVEQGYWSLTPKTALVRAPFANRRAAEWRLSDTTALADTVGLGPRLMRDGAAILRAYPPGLGEQGRQLLSAWPWTLLALSLLGLTRAAGRGPWLAFLVLPFVYPLLSAPADLRFAQLLVPALAVPIAAALGMGAFGVTMRAGLSTLGLAFSLGSVWIGAAGQRARAFDDGPMSAMRGAGAWLAAHTPESAVIMDRKSYVPFFANRKHVQLPDEPLGTLLDYARSTGATHVVVEEYVVAALRPQLAPLLDARAVAREPRVRLVFAVRPAPGEGVAVLEVVR